MRVSVFDDDQYFISNMEHFLLEYKKSQCPSLSIRMFTMDSELELYTRKNKSDVYLLDIATEDDKYCGIKLAKKIRTRDRDGHIIFLTSYEGRQSETYLPEIRASQYFTKPVKYEVLKKTLNKIHSLKNMQYLAVRFGAEFIRVNLKDIIYIERDARAVLITTAKQQYRINESLKSIFERLDNDFIYIDKGIIINTKKVKEVNFKEKKLVLEKDTNKYFSRNYNKVLKNYFLA